MVTECRTVVGYDPIAESRTSLKPQQLTFAKPVTVTSSRPPAPLSAGLAEDSGTCSLNDPEERAGERVPGKDLRVGSCRSSPERHAE